MTVDYAVLDDRKRYIDIDLGTKTVSIILNDDCKTGSIRVCDVKTTVNTIRILTREEYDNIAFGDMTWKEAVDLAKDGG